MQGSQKQLGRGATPLRFATKKKKKHYDSGVNANSTNHSNDFGVINNDEAFHNEEPHHFVIELFCAIFMLREWCHNVPVLFF